MSESSTAAEATVSTTVEPTRLEGPGGQARDDEPRLLPRDPTQEARAQEQEQTPSPSFGDMLVWQLAQLAQVSVGELVGVVVRAVALPQFPGMVERIVRADTSELEPELGRLLGLVTLQELELVVDRWVLGRVLEACNWNITHAAKRLRTTRRVLRERWRTVNDPAFGAMTLMQASAETTSGMCTGPSLTQLLEQGATYREIHRVVDRWVIEQVLEDQDGNVTRAAHRLGISRRRLRGLRDSEVVGSPTARSPRAIRRKG